MGEVIKNADSAHPSLLILVLFCVRILILRLSPSSLNELFRHIWPILLTLLVQTYPVQFKSNPFPIDANLQQEERPKEPQPYLGSTQADRNDVYSPTGRILYQPMGLRI